jgi:putative inorganic carbon (hco3(-)) transporter
MAEDVADCRAPMASAVNDGRDLAISLALFTVQAGLVLVQCAVMSVGGSLDGYTIPKELVLHAGALVAAMFLVKGGPRRLAFGAAELAIVLALALGVLSSLGSVNPWWALRAVALSVSGAVMFAVSAALARAGRGRHLLVGLSLAAVAGAITVAAEAYGLVPALSMPGRGPGGTAGNRNFMSHGLVLCVPALVAIVLRSAGGARRGWSAGLAVTVAAIVMARCRSAWLALGVLLLLGLVLLWKAARSGGRRSLVTPLVLPCLVGVAAAALVPNKLGWLSSAPYADTLRRLGQYDGGSGEGRLVQYATTARMIRARPLLGIGPGNWSVHYPAYAAPDDPSFDAAAIQPVNRLPNGDWLGLAAERGLPATLLLVFAGVVTAWRCRRTLGAQAGDEAGNDDGDEAGNDDTGRDDGGAGDRDGDGAGARRAVAAVGLAMTAVLAVLGCLDAVLLREEPTFFAAVGLGAAAGLASRPARAIGARPWLLGAGLVAATTAALAYAAARAAALLLTTTVPPSWSLAWALDPGGYTVGTQAALWAASGGDGETARRRAAEVLRVYPHSRVARRLSRDAADERVPVHRLSAAGAVEGITDWQVLGPFVAGGRPGDDHASPGLEQDFLAPAGSPEAGVTAAELERLAAAPARLGAGARARRMTGRSIDLVPLFGGRPGVTAYAAAQIEAGAPATAALLVGASAGLQVWVNGRAVAALGAERRGLRAHQQAAVVRLEAGRNLVLVKVASVEGAMGFSASVGSPPAVRRLGQRELAPWSLLRAGFFIPPDGRIGLSELYRDEPALRLELRDLGGRLVWSAAARGGAPELAVRGVRAGAYLLRVQAGEDQREEAVLVGAPGSLRARCAAGLRALPAAAERRAVAADLLVRLDHLLAAGARYPEPDAGWQRSVLLVARQLEALSSDDGAGRAGRARAGLHHALLGSRGDGTVRPYMFFVPESDATGPWPVLAVVSAAGAPARPRVDPVDRGLGAPVEEVGVLAALAAQHRVVVVWADLNSAGGTATAGADLFEVLDSLRARLPLDEGRVYLMGDGAGGGAALALAARSRGRFAAVAVANPGPGGAPVQAAGIPMLVVHEVTDAGYDRALALVAQARRAGDRPVEVTAPGAIAVDERLGRMVEFLMGAAGQRPKLGDEARLR